MYVRVIIACASTVSEEQVCERSLKQLLELQTGLLPLELALWVFYSL